MDIKRTTTLGMVIGASIGTILFTLFEFSGGIGLGAGLGILFGYGYAKRSEREDM